MKFIKYTIFLDLRMKNEKIKFQRNTHVTYEKKSFKEASLWMQRLDALKEA